MGLNLNRHGDEDSETDGVQMKYTEEVYLSGVVESVLVQGKPELQNFKFGCDWYNQMYL